MLLLLGAIGSAIGRPAVAQADLNDLEMAHVAVVASNIDIRYAHLALALSENQAVREFAETMIRDHSAVNAQVAALAKRLNVTARDNPFHPMVGDVRGEGLLAAIEFVEDKAARKLFDPAKKVGPQVAAALAKRNVIGRAMPQGDILGFAPPLCLTQAEADIVVSAAAEAVKEVAKGL
jgi:adenosylmethionine-8-amino-7-oxononanoate aminotransferase